MASNSTDLIVKRFMLRMAYVVYILMALLIGSLIFIPWFPLYPEYGGSTLLLLAPFLILLPTGMTMTLVIIELGKLFFQPRSDSPTALVSFTVAFTAGIFSILQYVGYRTISNASYLDTIYSNLFLVAAIGLSISFLAKFSYTLNNQKSLEQTYKKMLILSAGILFFAVIAMGIDHLALP